MRNKTNRIESRDTLKLFHRGGDSRFVMHADTELRLECWTFGDVGGTTHIYDGIVSLHQLTHIHITDTYITQYNTIP
jgi:hypothetical protein